MATYRYPEKLRKYSRDLHVANFHCPPSIFFRVASCRVLELGLRAADLDLRSRASGLGDRVQGLGFWILGCRVAGSGPNGRRKIFGNACKILMSPLSVGPAVLFTQRSVSNGDIQVSGEHLQILVRLSCCHCSLAPRSFSQWSVGNGDMQRLGSGV